MSQFKDHPTFTLPEPLLPPKNHNHKQNQAIQMQDAIP